MTQQSINTTTQIPSTDSQANSATSATSSNYSGIGS